ncbi:hypothetical protein GW17_00001859 [Ensete ventricosum]|nr:hypothetical protein GW17_00001859 [Ensete ventricosum]RZR85816.1 hypothetical protein BHM03_00012857 [Ensete ventricosum]
MEKWLFRLISVSFVFVLLFLSAISGFTASYAFHARRPAPTDVHRGPAHLPAFAYYISGGRGDSRRVLRLLLAVYHPRNRYLLHLSADASESERADLAARVWFTIPAVRAFGNVDVVGKASAMTPMGSSGLAATLHAASTLLRLDDGWDWFVTLSAEDYPLNTTVNSDLRYMVWDSPPMLEPHILNMTDFDLMTESGMPFARQFRQGDAVLDKIDSRILKRRYYKAVPGAWCSGKRRWWVDPCSQWGNADIVRPGPQAEKFEQLMKKLVDDWKSKSSSCR